MSFFNVSIVYIRSACSLLHLRDFWQKCNWISACSKIFYHERFSVSQFSLTDIIKVITLTNFTLPTFRNWVHKSNTSKPPFSFEISSSFLHKSFNCNSRLYFITPWIDVLYMMSFIQKCGFNEASNLFEFVLLNENALLYYSAAHFNLVSSDYKVWSTVFLRSWLSLSSWRNCPAFMEFESSLPYSEMFSISVYPSPDKYCEYFHTCFYKIFLDTVIPPKLITH